MGKQPDGTMLRITSGSTSKAKRVSQVCTLYFPILSLFFTYSIRSYRGSQRHLNSRKGVEASYHNTYPHALASSDCFGMKIAEVQLNMGGKSNASRGKDYIWLSSRFTAGAIWPCLWSRGCLGTWQVAVPRPATLPSWLIFRWARLFV